MEFIYGLIIGIVAGALIILKRSKNLNSDKYEILVQDSYLQGKADGMSEQLHLNKRDSQYRDLKKASEEK